MASGPLLQATADGFGLETFMWGTQEAHRMAVGLISPPNISLLHIIIYCYYYYYYYY